MHFEYELDAVACRASQLFSIIVLGRSWALLETRWAGLDWESKKEIGILRNELSVRVTRRR